MIKKIIILIIAIISVICIGIALYAYTQYVQEQGYVKITINGQELYFTKDMANDEVINIDTLNTEHDTIINLDVKNAKIKINNQKVKTKDYNLGKISINKDNKIYLYIKFFGDFKYTKYSINTIPSDFPEYEVEGKVNEDKEYYLTTFIKTSAKGNYYVYKINNIGEITFYKKTDYKAFNFKKNDCDGEIRYTYLEANKKVQYEGVITCLPATLVVLDEKYELIREIKYKRDIYTDNHDYIYFDDNHYIICGYTQEKVR